MSTYDDFIIDVLNINSSRIRDLHSRTDKDGNLSVLLTLNADDPLCPICKGKVKTHGYNEKQIIHSVLNNRSCLVIYRQRRYLCKKCNLTFSEHNPFGKRNERLSHETVLNILNDLKRGANTYTYVALKNNVSATTVQKTFDRYVNISRHKLPGTLSVDENYFPESDYDSLYMCIFMDFENGEIVDVLPDRKKDYLISYLSNIKNESFDDKTHVSELDNVKYVSIDMNDVYRDVFSAYCPKALICADEFHVIKNLTSLFNKVRLRCRRNSDDDVLIYLLTKFDFVFDHDIDLDNEPRYNKRLGRYINIRGIRDYLFEAFPQLKEAYELKEEYIEFNANTRLVQAEDGLNRMIERFSECGVREYEAFRDMMISWKKEIINSFTVVNGKRINNSYIESRNRNINTITYNANGLTNFKRARNRIMYCINKTDSYTFR